MGRFLATRLVESCGVLFGVTVLAFLLVYLAGNPAFTLMPADATPEQIARFAHDMGFDRPLQEQYLDFLLRAVRGDLGRSFRQGEPALGLVLERMPATLLLTTSSLVVALVIAVPLGIVAALRRNSLWDLSAATVAQFGQAMPTFWLGLVLILLVGVQLRWLPISGMDSPAHLILPSLTLGASSAAIIARLLRSSLLDVLGQDYVRTARGKGLRGSSVALRHALPNALLPVITVVGLQMGTLLGGAVITETVFSYPGMGLLAIQAIRFRDMPVVQAFVVVTAAVILVINLAVDLAYRAVDPRVRYER